MREGRAVSTPMFIGFIGVLLLGILFLPAAFYFFGPLGHCQVEDPICESESAILSHLSANQGRLGLLGYPAAAVAFLWLTRRTWHAWAALAFLSAIVVALGIVPPLAGFWEIRPQILGMTVPLISPGFTLWIAPALAFVLAGVLGSVRRHRDSA